MSTLFACMAALMAQLPQMPSVVFQECRQTSLHVAVQRVDNQTHLVHFHARFRNQKGKTAFARLRCEVRSDSENPVSHLSLKQVPIKENDELWSFFFSAQRFPNADPEKVTYQIELGEIDASEVDEYRVRESFAWRYRQGNMFVGTEQHWVGIPLPVRRIIAEGGRFRIVTEVAASARVTPIRYGIMTNMRGPENAASTAERLPNP